MIESITGKMDFIESLRGKKATFILALSNTETAGIDEITQARITEQIYLTPTLNSEFITTGELRSLDNIHRTSKGVATPALITRAVHLLNPFPNIELLNLGLEIVPKVDYFKIHNFDIKPSQSIKNGANIDAESIFQKGIEFAQNYICKDDYIILGQSVSGGTITTKATTFALGYDCTDKFSSRYKNVANNIEESTIQDAIKNVDFNDDIFKILGSVSDNMIIFNAGFVLGLNNKIPVVLAGGAQMVCVLLVVNKILEVMQGEIETSNLALATTSWIANDKHSEIEALLEMCSFKINSYFADFDFSLSSHTALKLYDEGEAKDDVGAGGALVYGMINGLSKVQITKQIENLIG